MASGQSNGHVHHAANGRGGITGTTRKEDSRARSVGWRFVQLEDLEGIEMETDEHEEVDKEEVVNIPIAGQGSTTGKRMTGKENGKEDSSVEKIVIKASHPSLLEGAKQVRS